MKIQKLDPQLYDALEAPGSPEELLVSIRLASDAQPEDLADLGRIVSGAIEPGLPVLSGRISSASLSELSDNAAVVRIRLSRRLAPVGV